VISHFWLTGPISTRPKARVPLRTQTRIAIAIKAAQSRAVNIANRDDTQDSAFRQSTYRLCLLTHYVRNVSSPPQRTHTRPKCPPGRTSLQTIPGCGLRFGTVRVSAPASRSIVLASLAFGRLPDFSDASDSRVRGNQGPLSGSIQTVVSVVLLDSGNPCSRLSTCCGLRGTTENGEAITRFGGRCCLTTVGNHTTNTIQTSCERATTPWCYFIVENRLE